MIYPTLLAVLVGCGPTPTSIELSSPVDALKEGSALQLQASVLDAEGQPIPDATLAWEVAPPEAARLEGDSLQLLKEGTATLVAQTGDLRQEFALTIHSPLVGEYERKTQPLKGMRIKVQPHGKGLVAEITRAPSDDEDSRAWDLEDRLSNVDPSSRKKLERNKQLMAYLKLIIAKENRCRAEAFAPGLHKLREFDRTGPSEWEARSLGSDPTETDPEVQKCEDYDLQFRSTMVVELRPDGALEVRDIASADASTGARQRWEPVEP